MADGARSALFARKQAGGTFIYTDETATTGNIFFVDSGAAAAADSVGAGRNPDAPFATIDFAIGQCVANNGDRIIVMPGHAEAVIAAGGLDIDVAGIAIIGIGVGNSRPTVTLGTAASADVDIDATDILIKNIRFVSDINDLARMIDANSARLTMEDCEFVTSSAKECFCFIDIATTVDDFIFRRCSFFQPTNPEGTDNGDSTGCFYYEDSENILIDDCRFHGFFETSIFHNKTTLAKEVWVRKCFGSQLDTTAVICNIVSGGTGGHVDCAWLVSTGADITTEALFAVIGATSPFGFHNTTFMNDNAGGENLALPVLIATT